MSAERPLNPGDDQGFTLIEVLVGLALLALTAAMLAGIVTGSRQVFRLLSSNEAAASVSPVQTYLRAALAHTVAVNERGDSPVALPSGLMGRADAVEFSTTYAQHGAFEGVYRVRLGLRPHSNGALFDLVVSQSLLRPPGPSPAGAEAGQATVILANVAGLHIRYFGKADVVDERPDWLDQWNATDRLPVMVGIRVRFAHGDARVWHPLDVRLNLGS